MKDTQQQLVSRLKLLNFKIRSSKKLDLYLCVQNGFTFAIYTGLIIAWNTNTDLQTQKILDYNLQSILDFMEK